MSLRRTLGLSIALVLSSCLAAPAIAGGDANFILGSKSLDKADWEPLETQGVFGAEVTFGKASWPVWIALDYLGSGDVKQDASIYVNGSFAGFHDLTGTTFELDLGVRKIWGKKKTRPFLGGGFGLIGAKLDATFVSDDDASAGVWAGGGVFWRLGRRFNIGGTVRWSDATVTLFGEDTKAGGLTYGLLLGWGWPGGS